MHERREEEHDAPWKRVVVVERVGGKLAFRLPMELTTLQRK